jgi:2,4-dienoyl-CoA reductase-like NADH-dependent reductase (Old Yellow Enzyme family)
MSMTPRTLDAPLALPCGATLPNRLCKAALTEGLADAMNHATVRHERLYRAWSAGGAGLVVTGNVQIDRRYLERPGNVVIDGGATGGDEGLDALRRYAAAGTVGGNHLWMQLNHPGRQTPTHVCAEPLAPSAVPLLNHSAAQFAPPRAMREDEIEDVVRRWAHAAAVARETGFTGIQVHAAHGYLLSQFLSPVANRRTDAWGGALANRARLLREVLRACRSAVGADFPIGVKLNSSDFQQGGFGADECLQVVRWLGEDGVDLLELSGGSYESPTMMGAKLRGPDAERPVSDSTRRREAYFLEYAAAMRGAASMPVMVTGGFRTRAAMDEALAGGALDMIGLGRPLCVDTDLPRRLLAGDCTEAVAYERGIDPPKAGLAWFCLQLLRLGDGLEPDRALDGATAMARYAENEASTARGLVGR